MNPELANSLYRLYEGGLKICQNCRTDIARLMLVDLDSEGELPEILRDRKSEAQAQPNARKNKLTFANSSELRKAYWDTQDKTEKWLTEVRNTLSEIPQKSLLIRFNEPFAGHDATSVQRDYTRYTYSKDMGGVLFRYDFLNDRLNRLLKIIEVCEKAATATTTPQAQALEQKSPKIAFNDMTGELVVNNQVVYTCKTYSKLGKLKICTNKSAAMSTSVSVLTSGYLSKRS